MSDEWVATTLDQAADVVMGSSPPGDTYNESGIGLPFLQGSAEFGEHFPSPVKWCSAPVKVACTGDLLVSVRAPVGDTNFAKGQTAIGRGLAKISSNGKALPAFLRLVVQFSTAELLSRSGTGMFTSITSRELKGFPFALPPLATQRRIVAVIDSIDKQIAALDAERNAALVVDRALRFSIFSSFDQPAVAANKKFGMLLGRQKSARQSVGDHVLPYLRAANVSDGVLKLSDVQTMNFDPKEQSKYGLAKDDVLLVEGGTIGLAARWNGEIDGCVGFDKHVIRLRALESQSTSEFALQWARYSRETRAFDELATGITIRALGFARASAMPVPDVSYEDQIRLMSPLAANGEFIAALVAEREALKATRSATLDALLSREIEIPESFDELLKTKVPV